MAHHNVGNVQAVRGLTIATDSTASSGVITWWRLAGNVSFQELHDAWVAAGMDPDELPSPPSDRVCFKRALERSFPSHAIRQSPDGSITVVAESFEKGEDGVQRPTYTSMLTAWLGEEDDICFDREIEDHTIAFVGAKFAEASVTLEHTEISSWLVRKASEHASVPLRDTGGIYFVPLSHVDRWQKLTAALTSVSAHTVAVIHAMRTEDAARAILDAVVTDATVDLTKLQRDFADTDKKARWWQSRAAKLTAIRNRVGTYEELFATKLPELRATFEQLEAVISIALMVEGDQ